MQPSLNTQKSIIPSLRILFVLIGLIVAYCLAILLFGEAEIEGIKFVGVSIPVSLLLLGVGWFTFHVLLQARRRALLYSFVLAFLLTSLSFYLVLVKLVTGNSSWQPVVPISYIDSFCLSDAGCTLVETSCEQRCGREDRAIKKDAATQYTIEKDKICSLNSPDEDIVGCSETAKASATCVFFQCRTQFEFKNN